MKAAMDSSTLSSAIFQCIFCIFIALHCFVCIQHTHDDHHGMSSMSFGPFLAHSSRFPYSCVSVREENQILQAAVASASNQAAEFNRELRAQKV